MNFEDGIEHLRLFPEQSLFISGAWIEVYYDEVRKEYFHRGLGGRWEKFYPEDWQHMEFNEPTTGDYAPKSPEGLEFDDSGVWIPPSKLREVPEPAPRPELSLKEQILNLLIEEEERKVRNANSMARQQGILAVIMMVAAAVQVAVIFWRIWA